MKKTTLETKYVVTVLCEGNPPFTTEVSAEREGLAKTRAMVVYPYPLSGQLVTYEVKVADHDSEAIVEEIDILPSDPCNSYLERVVAIDERNAGITMRKIVKERGLDGAKTWFKR